MADAGWFGDPTGRFGRRYFDGSAWSQHVVGANGDVLQDAMPESDAPYPPPSPTPAPFPQQGFGQQGFGQQGFGQPVRPYGPGAGPGAGPGGGPAVRYGVGAGLFLALAGLVLVALSLFAVSWGKGDKTRFTDFTSAAHKSNPTSFPDIGVHLYFVYVSWLAYVLFAAVLVLAVLAGIPVPRTGPGNRYWRIGASLLAGIAATLHSMTITYVFVNSGQTAAFGALSGLFGYGVVMVAMIFGARRIVQAPARAW